MLTDLDFLVRGDHVLIIVLCYFYSEEDSDLYCKLKEIRPRARKEIDIKDLKPGQTVMLNHNTDDLLEKGYWYVTIIYMCKI